jgi:hypothetical protein
MDNHTSSELAFSHPKPRDTADATIPRIDPAINHVTD